MISEGLCNFFKCIYGHVYYHLWNHGLEHVHMFGTCTHVCIVGQWMNALSTCHLMPEGVGGMLSPYGLRGGGRWLCLSGVGRGRRRVCRYWLMWCFPPPPPLLLPRPWSHLVQWRHGRAMDVLCSVFTTVGSSHLGNAHQLCKEHG